MPPYAQTNPLETSAASALQAEISQLGKWLTDQGLDIRVDHDHAHEGSRDRLYWRYGYFVGLKQALAMLTSNGATLH